VLLTAVSGERKLKEVENNRSDSDGTDDEESKTKAVSKNVSLVSIIPL
jgi:hypothetical protein